MIAAGIEYGAAGEGVPVVCLHGIGGGIESFAGQMGGAAPRPSASPRVISEEKKPRSGYRVMAWNMPGYGASESVIWPPSFQSLSEALGRFIEVLDCGPVHLVGQSIGGMVALEHGLRRPEQVRSLALIGTTPAFGGRDDTFREAFLRARLAPLEAGQSMEEMADAAAPGLVGPGADAEVIAAVAAPMRTVSEATWRGILECLVTFDRRADLEGLALPCCLIAGGFDRNAPARTMQKMAGRIPGAEFHLIEMAGHMINQEAPGEVNRILRAFWEGNE